MSADQPEDQSHEIGGSGLTRRILVGMAAGLAVGLVVNLLALTGELADFVVAGLLHVGGEIFLASLKLLVVPLVLVSLVCGTAALDDLSRLGRLGGRTLALYLLTTAVAISLAITAAVLIQPGAGFDLPTDLAYEGRTAPPLSDTLIQLFPTNPIKALADGNMLQIIVFAVLLGLAMTMAGEPGKRALAIFEDFNAVIMRLVALLMRFAPYGVFCLIAKVFAQQGFEAFQPLLKYFFVVLGVLITHAVLVYPGLLTLFARLDPIRFFRKMRAPQVVAFSTASSGATIPVTLRTVERRLGVDNQVASFTIPLGATINMDGTAIMQGVATVFIAQAYGIDIGIGGYLTVVLAATLASIGTAGVPGVGLIMLAMVLRQVNLPVEGIGLILGIDRLLDMVRTAVNITGDAAVTCIVAKGEGQLDPEVFADPEAGA
ncbi:MAG: dicarboxylate/amino acid:cation symporter [Deltaproteobacteria bacterium]|jgi:Na+/H+-dicarboxylate symporter|nr:dicarboxylate/amino acid:cation symporter [Deltaproteobacteria bacterium]